MTRFGAALRWPFVALLSGCAGGQEESRPLHPSHPSPSPGAANGAADASRSSAALGAGHALITAAGDARLRGAAQRCAEQGGQVTLAEIPGDHFDVYSSPVREQAAQIEVAFLKDRLR